MMGDVLESCVDMGLAWRWYGECNIRKCVYSSDFLKSIIVSLLPSRYAYE
jgi:hypothetical protein